MWTRTQAITLCKKVESVCQDSGCHVALTGGTLYKQGERKDCDILFYRIRQCESIDMEKLFDSLKSIGLEAYDGRGWCYKAEYKDKPVDMFFPEEQGGNYEDPEEDFEEFPEIDL